MQQILYSHSFFVLLLFKFLQKKNKIIVKVNQMRIFCKSVYKKYYILKYIYLYLLYAYTYIIMCIIFIIWYTKRSGNGFNKQIFQIKTCTE